MALPITYLKPVVGFFEFQNERLPLEQLDGLDVIAIEDGQHAAQGFCVFHCAARFGRLDRCRGGTVFLVALRDLADARSLGRWAVRHLAEEVVGVLADNTLAAKTRDLVGFINWYIMMNGHRLASGC